MISTNADRSNRHILKSVVEALLDSLTVEQQTKMASYLQRAARQQSKAQRRADVRRLAVA